MLVLEAKKDKDAIHRGRPVVAAHNVWKRYGGAVALAGVTFEVWPGEVVGVLGPNGAGKTTLLEILEGLRVASAGRVTVLGAENCHPLPKEVLARLGVATQGAALPQLLTVEEVLRLYASFYRRPVPVTELIERAVLGDKRTAQVRHLSGGQHQRLVVALAVLGRPELVILDEPTAGLDPQARRTVWELIRNSKLHGDAEGTSRSVILTTHQMDEAATLCGRISIIDHGRILASGSPTELVERFCPGCVVRFRTDRNLPASVSDAASELTHVDATYTDVLLRGSALEPCLELIMGARRDQDMRIINLRVERSTLEDVFLTLTGREIRE